MRQFFLAILLLCYPLSLFSQTGLSFLQVGVTAREQALANTGVASAQSAAANYYNSALLSASEKSGILFSQSFWLLDTYASYVATKFNFGQSALGVSLFWLTVSNIPIRLRPTPTPEGTFAAQNLAASVAYSQNLTDKLAIALTGKFLFERIFIDDATGFAVDISGLFRPLQGLTLGASLQNVGAMNALASESTRLPALLRIGAAYQLMLPTVESSLILEANAVSVFSDAAHLSVGAEYMFRELLWLRIGAMLGNAARNFSAGVGIKWASIVFDYAFIPFTSQLGSANILTLQFQY
ncbi:MAG: PorV/PorQ family protein [Chloroherpetonaceae bacterium]|nr:PorV/PorQ family protein [Chloroherpetonaceae bacterium]MCS7211892.1 PorV/PorQ family protein [Chloroherpetonaceae bacterium]MDW8019669.1 PorV/PorQ family protein [Chloroherpetonaceae bacterium]MDW8465258.1 PorV/PorQ family protein [Chloroherpetonaceae bacterium]